MKKKHFLTVCKTTNITTVCKTTNITNLNETRKNKIKMACDECKLSPAQFSCKACAYALYCSPDCQRAAWLSGTHPHVCQFISTLMKQIKKNGICDTSEIIASYFGTSTTKKEEDQEEEEKEKKKKHENQKWDGKERDENGNLVRYLHELLQSFTAHSPLFAQQYLEKIGMPVPEDPNTNNVTRKRTASPTSPRWRQKRQKQQTSITKLFFNCPPADLVEMKISRGLSWIFKYTATIFLPRNVTNFALPEICCWLVHSQQLLEEKTPWKNWSFQEFVERRDILRLRVHYVEIQPLQGAIRNEALLEHTFVSYLSLNEADYWNQNLRASRAGLHPLDNDLFASTQAGSDLLLENLLVPDCLLIGNSKTNEFISLNSVLPSNELKMSISKKKYANPDDGADIFTKKLEKIELLEKLLEYNVPGVGMSEQEKVFSAGKFVQRKWMTNAPKNFNGVELILGTIYHNPTARSPPQPRFEINRSFFQNPKTNLFLVVNVTRALFSSLSNLTLQNFVCKFEYEDERKGKSKLILNTVQSAIVTSQRNLGFLPASPAWNVLYFEKRPKTPRVLPHEEFTAVWEMPENVLTDIRERIKLVEELPSLPPKQNISPLMKQMKPKELNSLLPRLKYCKLGLQDFHTKEKIHNLKIVPEAEKVIYRGDPFGGTATNEVNIPAAIGVNMETCTISLPSQNATENDGTPFKKNKRHVNYFGLDVSYSFVFTTPTN
jgi:hypothetical protein